MNKTVNYYFARKQKQTAPYIGFNTEQISHVIVEVLGIL